MVEVNIGTDHRVEPLKPDAGIFWTRRAWDQRAERGYMKQIEDRFQPLADRIASGELTEIPDESAHDVNQFFLLWFHRSRIQPADEIETQTGLTGDALTKDKQEILESWHVTSVRAGGKIATRHLTGQEIEARIMGDNRNCGARRWGVIHAPEGEFVMPDVPAHDLMPITPTVLLAANHPSGIITKSNLISINTEFLAYTRRYFFGRDLKIALAGVTGAAIQKAVMERDRKIAAEVAHLKWPDCAGCSRLLDVVPAEVARALPDLT